MSKCACDICNFYQSTFRKLSKDFPNFNRYNEDIEKYNNVAVKIAEKYGFKINDLYALSATLPEEAYSDAVHYYTPAGTEAFTNQVLSIVVPELGIDEVLEYHEEIYTDKPIGI